jgi:parvulin-like peptidyl-prolyl isomerase
VEEAEKAKIEIPPADVDAELKNFLKHKGGMLGNDLEKIEREYGSGVLNALKRSVRADLGLMTIFHNEKKLKPDKRTDSREFEELKRSLVERRVKLSGVEIDPQKLGTGEGVRIGARSYSRDEVRRYIIEAEGQIPKSELFNKLSQLTLEKLIKAQAAAQSLSLTENDRNFHFSYMCRLKEQQLGVNGRAVMRQIMQEHGMNSEQYLQSRIFSFDALMTLIVKKSIGLKELRAEFAVHPEKYKVSESLTAHIFVQVLDPDGHPYGPNWQAAGFPALNKFSAERREEQYAAAKSKIDGLVPLAKDNFEETARKYSDDPSRRAAGLIGRLGARTIPTRPIDEHVRDAAVKLKPGEISAPVRSDYGWHILKCLEKQDVTYEEVEERVYITLIHEAKEALMDKLLKTAKVEDKF